MVSWARLWEKHSVGEIHLFVCVQRFDPTEFRVVHMSFRYVQFAIGSLKEIGHVVDGSVKDLDLAKEVES